MAGFTRSTTCICLPSGDCGSVFSTAPFQRTFVGSSSGGQRLKLNVFLRCCPLYKLRLVLLVSCSRAPCLPESLPAWPYMQLPLTWVLSSELWSSHSGKCSFHWEISALRWVFTYIYYKTFKMYNSVTLKIFMLLYGRQHHLPPEHFLSLHGTQCVH